MSSPGAESVGSSVSIKEASLLGQSPALRLFCERWDSPDVDAAMFKAMAELRRVSGQTAPPFGLQKVLSRVNARSVRSPMSPRGRLQASRDGWVIHVPPDVPWRVGRFTVAHELAHVVLFDAVHADRSLIKELRSEDELWWPIERLCDRGAAEFLVPSDDIRQVLDSELPESKRDAFRLYDRYLVSASVLVSRICDLGEGRSYTTWEHTTTGVKPADWRITFVHSNLPKRSSIPKRLSAQSRLSPNLVAEASRTGFAFAEEATLATNSQRHTGRMFAFNPTMRDKDDTLPTFEGKPVPDNYSPTIHLLIDHRSVGPISQRTRFA